ncbi:MAG: hypothetical protein OEP52_08330 [Acidimicrobiia bacterium]|nr:hypothetical protein [Acidimicrobiia bacterium]
MRFDPNSWRRLLVLVALTLAACTTDPAVPSTSSTTTPASTTTAPATSTAPSTTTTAPSTTTTLLEPDTFLTVGNTCLLGWWDGVWQSGDDLPVSGGEDYQVVRLDEPITSTTGSEARPSCEPLDLVSVEFDPAIPGDFLEVDALAIQTGTAVRPYPVQSLALSIPTYIQATSELLETRVAGIPIINLTQVIRTDLEGDGTDEVIVAASTIPDDLISSQVGDYSIVYLRKVIEGELQTAILGVSIVEDLDNLFQDLAVFNVAAVADLNGDGTMEIVINGIVWEGAFLQAWEYINDDLGPVEVLSCGCGS